MSRISSLQTFNDASEAMVVNLQQFDFFPDEMSLLPPVAFPRPMMQRIGVRRSRQRGVVLTKYGWRKLLEMKVLQNQHGEWHTHKLLGDRALISPRTVSKIVGREMGADRRTLKQFFDAFSLRLESDDYRLTSGDAKPSCNCLGAPILLEAPAARRSKPICTASLESLAFSLQPSSPASPLPLLLPSALCLHLAGVYSCRHRALGHRDQRGCGGVAPSQGFHPCTPS